METQSSVTSLVIMLATIVRCSKNLLGYINCVTKKNFLGPNRRSSLLPVSFFRRVSHSISSCLSHVVNLRCQVLISTYSKSPHYAPHDPKAHEPDTSKTNDRDEVGLICAICVKVCLILRHMLYFIKYFSRNAHQPNERNFTRWFR
jgi:hypothetical protein